MKLKRNVILLNAKSYLSNGKCFLGWFYIATLDSSSLGRKVSKLVKNSKIGWGRSSKFFPGVQQLQQCSSAAVATVPYGSSLIPCVGDLTNWLVWFWKFKQLFFCVFVIKVPFILSRLKEWSWFGIRRYLCVKIPMDQENWTCKLTLTGQNRTTKNINL